MPFLLQWAISAVAVAIAAYLLPGVHLSGAVATVIAALILGIANAVIRPILHVLALPITLLTFGLFALVVNAFVVLLVAWVVPGFRVDGLGWAILFSIILAIIGAALRGIATR